MNRVSMLVAIASLSYAVSWFLPTTTFSIGDLPGWEALKISFAPIWDGWDGSDYSWLRYMPLILSGMTNGWFVFSVLALAIWSAIPRRLVFWGLLLSALVNSVWFTVTDSGDLFWTVLRIGYYLWYASFLMLTFAAHWSLQLQADSGSEARDQRPNHQ